MTKRVVITGLGALTALGEGAQALWEAVLQKKSGLTALDLLGEKFPGILAAVIRDFDPEKYVTQRKALKVMARDIQLAVAGASLAIDDSKVRSVPCDPERFGVIVGSGVLNHELDELSYSVQNSLDESGKLDLTKFGDTGLSALFPLWLLKYLPNMSACHISVLFDLQGMNNTITTGASAGMQAVGEAMRIIQRGDADLMLAGGAESKVNPVGISQYKVLGALDEEGFAPGEGAGFLLLEELEHAKKRGAKIYAEIVGFGSSFSGGRQISMRCAMREAGISALDIRYLQAAGLGLKKEDMEESQAIHEVFNGSGQNLAVSSSKSITGFTGFSAGALDLILSTLALKNQIIPPSGGLKTFNSTVSQKNFSYAMTNASGLSGQAVSVVTKVFKEK